MTTVPTSAGPTRVRRTPRAPAQPREVSPEYLPSGMAERREWLAAVPRELDDARVMQALADLKGDDLGAQSRACATIWRALKPLIQSTAIRLQRQFVSQSQDAVFDVIDGQMTEIVLNVRATTAAAFFSYASLSMSHASTMLFREVKTASRDISLSTKLWEHSGHSRSELDEALDVDAPSSAGDSPDPDQIEALLVEAIEASVTQENQREALHHYFGIGAYRGRGEKTHASVGRQHSLSGERVRQLVARVRAALYVRLGIEDDEADGDE